MLPSRESTTRLVGLEAKSLVPQQQAWDLLTGGGWFSCSWKLTRKGEDREVQRKWCMCPRCGRHASREVSEVLR
jgi:hypothetical protein